MKDTHMTRPRKDPTTAKATAVLVRLTIDEKSHLENTAKKARLSMSEYIRRVSLSGKISDKSKDLQASRMDAETLAELARIGNNINQIAFKLNAGRGLPSGFDHLQHQLYQTLEIVGRRFDT